MKHIVIAVILVLMSGCNGGRPLMSPRLDVVIDQDYIIRNAKSGRADPERLVAATPKLLDAVEAGLDRNLSKGERIAGATMVLIALMVEASQELAYDGPRQQIAVTIDCAGRRYHGDFSYGANRIKMDDQMIADLQGHDSVWTIVATGPWTMQDRVSMPPIRNPKTCKVHFASDSHVFIDGDCVR